MKSIWYPQVCLLRLTAHLQALVSMMWSDGRAGEEAYRDRDEQRYIGNIYMISVATMNDARVNRCFQLRPIQSTVLEKCLSSVPVFS